MPPQEVGLGAVLSYYSSTVRVNPEGDVHLSDETIHGLGITSSSLTNYLFGAITQIALSPRTLQEQEMVASNELPHGQEESKPSSILGTNREKREIVKHREVEALATAVTIHRTRSVLTQFVPAPGYFLAGGLSGVISRTTTAPLDRLKVYLIAQTGTASEAVSAAKSGSPLKATRHGTNTLVTATKELWAAGGMRSLFAGQKMIVLPSLSFADRKEAMASMS